ncbi:hypothetical protein FHL15_001772 [Xylaria flabelliformis]|uniref:MINDY deubiquitinase domain-containing protein n=1 Tax=Xylaria flabelliformis TaxID=2512241 RepID=A0A553IBB7_9PEZI|nr:hypothetical protein FHL15_001772 [Xylaria flabelliformis]
MVKRKSTAEIPSASDTQANSEPTMANPPRIEVWSATDSEVDSERIWGASDQAPLEHSQTTAFESADVPRHVPEPLLPGATTTNPPYEQGAQNPWSDIDKEVVSISDGTLAKLDKVPNVLRPGVARSETNPFKRKPLRSPETVNSVQRPPNGSANASESSIEAFPLPPAQESPDHSTNPWQPALKELKDYGSAHEPPSLLDQDLDANIWDSRSQSTSSGMPAGNVQPTSSPGPAPANPVAVNSLIDENAWEEEESSNKGKQPVVAQSEITPENIDGWNLVEHESTAEPGPGNLSKRSTWEDFVDLEDDTAKEVATRESEQAPALPPRTSVEVPPPQPPRRQSPNNVNMAETYQIKNINWHDSKAAVNPRKSPILVQNANGPCPLVALVNALTLTTPADRSGTSLAEILGSREQISLSFLLEVVVEELVTSRHLESNTPLPDMSELYSFLQGLHTGMNVNPRFIPASEAVDIHKQTSIHSPEGNSGIPGTFEKTRDTELYAAFKIPLIHGWLPPKNDPVYDALERRATSYDDAQNLLFHEEELEDKFSNSPAGLTDDEQQLYQDIMTIKSFLSTTATQLTPSGLEVVTQSIKPGDVSILFRNDHFSTLYRHPQTHQLFTLVTDAGYFTHDEVVWESLADVRGERTEFFSGDFRVVGGNQLQRALNNGAWSTASTSNNNDWQTVQNRRSRSNQQSQLATTDPPHSPQHEQEDRDLALALQLQEEEEERHRSEQAARRRESRLSEQFIEQQGRDGGRSNNRTRGGSISSTNRGSTHSLPPPRGGSTNQLVNPGASTSSGRPVQQVRSLIPPRTHRPADDELDDAPPSYEQAAKSTPYLPPAGHPSHPDSNPRSPEPRRSSRSQSNAAAAAAASSSTSLPHRPRQSVPSVAATAASASGGSSRDRDCNVM